MAISMLFCLLQCLTWLLIGLQIGKPIASFVNSTSHRLDGSTVTPSTSISALKRVENRFQASFSRASQSVVAVKGGSGVIVSSDGLVVTASHVAGREGDQVSVRLANGITWPAVTLTVDREHDLGWLKLSNYDNWPYLKLRNQPIEVGVWVAAIGYPLSFPRDTAGAIRLGNVRAITSSRITTTCAIMGGDSGGPLIDSSGHLVGINSSIKLALDENYHVAVSQIPQPFLKQLTKAKTDEDLVLGHQDRLAFIPRMERQAEHPDVLEDLRLKIQQSLVSIRIPDSRVIPATVLTDQGLLVTKFSSLGWDMKRNPTPPVFTGTYQGKELTLKLISYHSVNDLALLEVVDADRPRFRPVQFSPADTRQSQSIDNTGRLLVSLIDGDSEKLTVGNQLTSIRRFSSLPNQRLDFGVIVDQIPQDQFQTSIHLHGGRAGVVVDRVYPDSLADQAGMKVGDIILSINGVEIQTQRQLTSLSESMKDSVTIEFAFDRHGQQFNKSFDLSSMARPSVFDRWGGGPFSVKRFGFGPVLAHSIPIAPEVGGSPLLDLQGRLAGINISRAMRVSSYAIPAAEVINYIRRIRPAAELEFANQ